MTSIDCVRHFKWLWVVSALCTTIAIAAIACTNKTASGNSTGAISYNFHIRPILSDKCFVCHGPDANKRAAHLRLDNPESAYAPLKETKGAFAIVPGKPDQSEVYKRIISTDPTYQMPAPGSHLGLLTEQQIALVRKWIQQGAKYEKHWAFISPVKPTLPAVDDQQWVKNEVDYFILSAIQEKGLNHNEEADKERLLKRLAFDLTGLPPTVQMMDDYLNDASANAYEKMVDRLLTNTAYGEKWQCIGSMLPAMPIPTATRMIISAPNGPGAIG